jgi:hypothetical protein
MAAVGSGIASGFRRSDALVVAAESQPLTLRFSHQPLDMFLRVFLPMGFASTKFLRLASCQNGICFP